MLKPQQIELEAPTKWDIIPIHTSDRAAFKACRRKWGWSSPAKSNLVPKASVHGIRANLWFGTGIHYALEKYYNPTLQEDPVVAWLTWFKLQWEGGIVTLDEVPEYIDRDPERQADGTYYVSGLQDLLPNPDEIKLSGQTFEPEEVRELGVGMLRFYQEYAEREDDFRTIAVEHNFSVPILHPKSGTPMYKPDVRTMPPEWEPDFDMENYYGKVMVRDARKGIILKQVHARGRMDKIVQEEQGRYGIHDYKSTSRLDDDYFRHLDLDEQCTTYLWAGEREAKMYDLEYDNLDFIIYEGLLKAYPKPPTQLKSGLPSINRQTESTTAEMFEQFIKENGLKVIFDADPKLQSYYVWLLETGDERFIDRRRVWRNEKQRENAGIRLYYEAEDMLNNPRLYPNPRKEYSCLNCIFRAPCIAAEDGSDWEQMIADGYVQNWDR